MHGDSAGGNLALVAALRHPGRFAAAVLIYPFLDPTAGFESYDQTGNGFDPREAALVLAAVRRDAGGPRATRTSRRCVSDRLRHAARRPSSSPPSTTRCATRGRSWPGGWPRPGVAVTATRYLGQIHGFWRHHAVFPAAEQLLQQVAGFLRTVA